MSASPSMMLSPPSILPRASAPNASGMAQMIGWLVLKRSRKLATVAT
jgi:hypothetical protein